MKTHSKEELEQVLVAIYSFCEEELTGNFAGGEYGQELRARSVCSSYNP